MENVCLGNLFLWDALHWIHSIHVANLVKLYFYRRGYSVIKLPLSTYANTQKHTQTHTRTPKHWVGPSHCTHVSEGTCSSYHLGCSEVEYDFIPLLSLPISPLSLFTWRKENDESHWFGNNTVLACGGDNFPSERHSQGRHVLLERHPSWLWCRIRLLCGVLFWEVLWVISVIHRNWSLSMVSTWAGIETPVCHVWESMIARAVNFYLCLATPFVEC